MKNNIYLAAIILLTSFSLFTRCKKESKPIPVADFSYTGANVPAPALVIFTNLSTDATSYYWDFGDNGTSTEKNPQHTYLAGGVFTVKLTATGEGGSNSVVKTVNIQNPAPPVANFTFSGGPQAPCTITFTNQSQNANSYSWDFGDGQSSIEKNPSHLYTTGGNFNVQLTATGEGGSNSITKTLSLQNPITPVAGFSFSGGGSQAPCNITFTNESQNATTYSWDFGDGQTSVEKNPTHTYTTGGNFNVQLTATNVNGSDNITKSVNILPPPTVCKISGISILNCPLVDGTGTSWDLFSGPDFYFNIETESGIILVDGSSSYNTDNSSFPQSWTFNPTYNFSNLYFSATYKIHIWEHDSPDPDDDVSYVNFKLSDYTTLEEHYPTQFTITNGATQVKFTVQWQ